MPGKQSFPRYPVEKSLNAVGLLVRHDGQYLIQGEDELGSHDGSIAGPFVVGSLTLIFFILFF